ncbi:MAG: hypothetical protein F6K65_17450 [Moorea sp. SIO3C2]|nr:hypothetical protein [Moorena sp. SIO3C2]
MGGTTAVAHGGNHGSRSWGKPRQSLLGETPKTALHRYSLLPTPYSLLPTPYSILPTPYSLLPLLYKDLSIKKSI